jgi:hypothetical protein
LVWLAIETGIAPTLWEAAGHTAIETAFEVLVERNRLRG